MTYAEFTNHWFAPRTNLMRLRADLRPNFKASAYIWSALTGKPKEGYASGGWRIFDLTDQHKRILKLLEGPYALTIIAMLEARKKEHENRESL